jgi:hypothetical protein
MACETCTRGARLHPSGISMGELIGAAKAPGNVLNVLLNPVAIKAYRGWMSYSPKGLLVLEELERSRDWFEFIAQHVEPGPSALDWLRERESLPADVTELMQALTKYVAPRNIAPLVNAWALTQTGKRAIEKSGPIQSPGDLERAIAAFEAAAAELANADDLAPMVARLRAVADVE